MNVVAYYSDCVEIRAFFFIETRIFKFKCRLLVWFTVEKKYIENRNEAGLN